LQNAAAAMRCFSGLTRIGNLRPKAPALLRHIDTNAHLQNKKSPVPLTQSW
jgi:hypothetical protein